MYCIKCNGVEIYSIIPHLDRGISFRLVDDEHFEFLVFDELFHAHCVVHLLQEVYPNKHFEVFYLG